MFYRVPPAGTPIRPRDLIGMIPALFQRKSESLEFGKRLKSSVHVGHCLFFNSGRVALYHILKALSRLSSTGKDEIIMPAYTCFSVASAVARAGMKMRLVDIDPSTMDYDYDRLSNIDFGKVLAIISCNLFGLISDWRQLEPFGREQGIYLIEDAAQTLGITLDEKPSGSFGDVAFFSFGRGKNLSTYSGGAVVTGNVEIAETVRGEMSILPETGLISETDSILKMILYSVFLHPRLYWFPDSLPFLNLGETVFDMDFTMGRISEFQKLAGGYLYPQLEEFNNIRANNSRKIGEALLCNGRRAIPGYSQDNCPPYLRLPVIVSDKAERDKLIVDLRKLNIVASAMYPSTIRRIPGIEKYLASEDTDFPGAQTVVDRLLCLPTHPYLRESDLEKIIQCFSENSE